MMFMPNLRKRLSLLRHGFSFYNTFIDGMYEKQLGHKKIIAFEEGKAVYSLLMPALLSNPYRHFLSQMISGVLLNTRVPFGVNLAVTDRCNSNCEHCIFKSIKQDKTPMGLKELSQCITDCHDLGLTTINLLGGEPLVSPHILNVIQLVDKTRANLLLFTNGSLLAPMALKLKRAGLKRVMVSIDFPEPGKHDAFRNHKGLFDKAVRGIMQARREGMLVGISTTITPKTTGSDYAGLFELGRELGICEIFMSKEYNYENMSFYQDHLEDEFYGLVKKINNDKNYQFGIFYYPFFMKIGFGCSAGATRLYISPYGDVTPCECSQKSFGNIRTEKLRTIWERMYKTPQLGYVTKDGCRAQMGII